ncbi:MULTISPECIES: FAD-dependent oxidoreductase [unclassified Blastococcus]
MSEPTGTTPLDLLVVGGGMAGLTAAAAVARAGGAVTVLERADELGGSTLFAGYAWTAPSADEMAEVNPGGDRALADRLVSGFAGGIEWIRGMGVECGPAVRVLRYGTGHAFDTGAYVTACARAVRDAGGDVRCGVDVRRLLVEDGTVVGAEVAGRDGAVEQVTARHTLLATGGFQADDDLRRERLHEQGPCMPLRSNPHSDGGGLRLGLAAGAAFGQDDAGFYGHLVPSGVALDPGSFVELALYYSEHSLLFDLAGERFVDETVGDHLTTMALLERPGARGLLVADAVTHRDWVCGSYVEGIPGFDRFERCMRRGARGAVADSLADFDDMPPEWGYPGAAIREGIERFNAAMASGTDDGPGRAFDRRPQDVPPFYVLEAVPAITFTLGGLLIDEHARVRAAGGGVVPGLLSAGADAGGLYRRAYAGGIAPALVFGLAAARTATSGTPS